MICTCLSTVDNPSGIPSLFGHFWSTDSNTSSINMENLAHLMRRMFLHQGGDNQPSIYFPNNLFTQKQKAKQKKL